MASKMVGISWGARSRTYFKADNSFYDAMWKKAKAKRYNSVSDAGYTYWDHVTNAASIASFTRDPEDTLLSAEALPENSSLLGFKAFAKEYPERLFPLVSKLRAEFQELFVEYYLLEKSQSFIAKAHGQIQTRVWQNLRVIEQSIGSLILLGTNPDAGVLQPILKKTGLEETSYGSLTTMILLYAASQNYALVAKTVGAPTPAIRKIFRPAIAALLADKNVKAVAVGAYLRSLTHQASLTGGGLSKRCIARTRRVKNMKFQAPPRDESPLISFGPVAMLKDTPWCMFEISSEHRMSQIYPIIKNHGRKLFGKKAAQIFAPVNADGELEFNYIFARSVSPALTRSITRVRGVSEMATACNDEGTFTHAITVPDTDIQEMMARHPAPEVPRVHHNDFVEILTGDAARYCGTIVSGPSQRELVVEVVFPTGRKFVVTADATCLKILPKVPMEQRAFWGVLL